MNAWATLLQKNILDKPKRIHAAPQPGKPPNYGKTVAMMEYMAAHQVITSEAMALATGAAANSCARFLKRQYEKRKLNRRVVKAANGCPCFEYVKP